jgi:hypothetical protein
MRLNVSVCLQICFLRGGGGAGRVHFAWPSAAELLALDGAIETYDPFQGFERNGVKKIEIFLGNF